MKKHIVRYLVIGTVVQAIIIAERGIRGKVKEGYENFETRFKHPRIQCTFSVIVASLPNILCWPITIICELFNIKHDM